MVTGILLGMPLDTIVTTIEKVWGTGHIAIILD